MSDFAPAVLEDIYRVVSVVDKDAETIEVELGLNTKDGYIISYVLQDLGLIIMSKVMIGQSNPQDFQTIGSMQ